MNQHSKNVWNDDGVVRRPETKSFVLTSEFWVAAGAAAAVFIGGYVLNDIANATAWKYGVWIAIGYIVSRGIAKAGSQRAYQAEPQITTSRVGDRNGRDGVDVPRGEMVNEPARPYDASGRP